MTADPTEDGDPRGTPAHGPFLLATRPSSVFLSRNNSCDTVLFGITPPSR